MKKEDEIMDFLHERVFDPVLNSNRHSKEAKRGIRYTIMRIENRKAEGMIGYYWSSIYGTERSIRFSQLLKRENAKRFEDVIDEFRIRFNDKWLRSK